MKPIIINMKEMSDSTEVYESRPNPFMVYVIYLVLAILVIALVWMYFFKIDILVKGNGMFRSDEDIYDISSSVTGKVQSSNVSDGQFVNEGDVLFTVSIDSLDETIKAYENELEDINQRIAILQAYEKYLDGDAADFEAMSDNKYYQEFYNKKQLLDANISSSDKNTDEQRQQYKSSIEDINTSISQYELQITKLKQVRECVITRINIFTSDDSYYDSMVKSYISNYNLTSLQYDNQIKEYQQQIDEVNIQLEKSDVEAVNEYSETSVQNIGADTQNVVSASGINKEELNKQLETLNNYIETTESEKQKALNNLELQQLSNIEQQIESINSTLLSLESNLTSAQVQLEAVSGADTDTINSISVLTEKSNIANELLTYNSKKTECENKLKSYDVQSGNCNIVADVSGYIQLEQEIKQGAYVQEGTTICQIYPQTVESYYAEIYVENSDIAKLEEGQKVKFEIAAYPSSEYGYFTGVIENISKDIRVDQNSGSAYYLVKARCDEITVQNKEGKTGSIINGMACQAKIVVDEQNVLRWLLEKLSFLD